MTGRTIHVVGAGLAGLSAAVRLTEAGRRVVLHEAAKAAGGRCRSYYDPALDLTIDNGNHLVLSGNRSALGFASLVGGTGALTIADEALFPFVDLGTGERWRLRPNAGRLPWWIFAKSRRVPGTRPLDYLAPAPLMRAGPDVAIGDVMRCQGLLYERLWRPVLLAALNTDPPESSARLAGTIIRESLGKGGDACRPVVATGGLSAAFVDPALDHLARGGAEVRFGARLRAIDTFADRATELRFADATVQLGEQDGVVLAVPSWVAADLMPDLTVPTKHRAILNAHFRIVPPAGQPLFLGMVNSLAEWLFAYPDRLSVTISGADRLLDADREETARTIWAEIARVAAVPAEMPRWQIVKEKRATFAATPAQDARRPDPVTRLSNVTLAGDWTATGLPATIEGAIRSGENAAALLQRRDSDVSCFVSKA